MFEKEDFDKYMKDSEDYYDNREPMTERKLYQLWKDGAEFGYKKANEWHYVKDGDLPKEEKEYLVYKIDGYGCKSIQVMQFNNQHCWCANCQNEIIAWKEIVLPKEIE